MLPEKVPEKIRLTQAILRKIAGAMDENRQITGSRYSDGNVPNVNWNDGKMNVNWYNPGNANDNLRARSEVSKKKSLPRDFFVIGIRDQTVYPIGGVSGNVLQGRFYADIFFLFDYIKLMGDPYESF